MRRWPWWKRILAALGLSFVLLAAFYQPIVFTAVEIIAREVGARQGLRIELQPSGTLFTGLTIRNLSITPSRPGPIEKCKVGRLDVHYDLVTLIRGGLGSGFLRELSVRDADVVYDPNLSPPPPPTKKEAFQLPPLPFPDRLSLQNINILVRPASKPLAKANARAAAASSAVPAPAAPAVAGAAQAVSESGLLLAKFSLDLEPERAGTLHFDELNIPGGPDLKHVDARTTYRARDLELTDLLLAPALRFRRLGVDASQLDKQMLAIRLDGDVFEGRLLGNIQLTGIGKPPAAHVDLSLNDVSLASTSEFLKLSTRPTGWLRSLTVKFDGQSDRPKTWEGLIDARVAEPAAPPAKLDRIDVRLVLSAGTGVLEKADVAQGANFAGATARILLPERIEDLSRASARGEVRLAIPDFRSLPVALPPELGLRGSLSAGGPFSLEDGKFSVEAKGRASDLSVAQPPVTIASTDFEVTVSKALPPDATTPATAPNTPAPAPGPFFEGLKSKVVATVTDARVMNYRLDGISLNLATDQASIKLERVDVSRGANKVHIEASYELPPDGNVTNWQVTPLSASLALVIPDLNQFSADPQAEPLAGRLTANGRLSEQQGSFSGGFELAANDLAARGLKVQAADVQIGIERDAATIKTAHVRLDERSGLDAAGRVQLQVPYGFQGEMNLNLPDLSILEPALLANGVEQKVAGSLKIAAKASGRRGSMPGGADQQIDAQVDVTARDLAAAGARIQSADTRIVVQNSVATIQAGQVRFDPKNVIGFGGTLTLSGEEPFDLAINADLPELSAFDPALLANKLDEKIAGAFRLESKLSGKLAGAPSPSGPAGASRLQLDEGFLLITAKDLQAMGAKLVQSLNGRVAIEAGRARIQTLNLRFDEKNTVDMDGQAALTAPFDYQASLNVNLPDLHLFEPLLKISAAHGATAASATLAKPSTLSLEGSVKKKPPGSAPKPAPARGRKSGPAARDVAGTPNAPRTESEPRLAGSLQVQWQGDGNLAAPLDAMKYTGSAKVTARGLEFNALGPAEADVAGRYSRQAIDFPTLSLRVNGFELRGTVALKDSLLRLDNLHLLQGQADLLSGYAQLPLDLTKLSSPAGPVPDEEKIDMNIASQPLDIPRLFAAVEKNQPSPVQGTVALAMTAHGSLSKIAADVKVQARQLRARQQPGISPADADVELSLRDDRLNLVSSIRQPQIQPVSIKGNVPLDLRAVVSNKTLDPKSPVFLEINLPSSDLSAFAKLSPQLAYVVGRASADVRVGGSIEKPSFGGAVDLAIPGVRFQDITLPRVSDFAAHIAFTDRQIRFERFGGDLSGGKFSLSGQVDFARLTPADAKISLALHADNALLFRNDNITGRANADVRVSGSLAAATVSGAVGITKSRFLKEIEILPLDFPGRPAPAPPAAASPEVGPESIGVNAPFIKDWKLNLAIKTSDPFLIRSNLVNGKAAVDIKVEGTGARPLVSGYISVDSLSATLPFSRLDINTGNVQLTPDQPLNPVLNLRGTSEINERIVTIFISGRAHNPQITMSSEPPLPQSDIVSLLATGSTTSELTGNSQALAGKATLFVLQDLYRRTFKKKESASGQPQSSLSDRVSLDVGSVDPRTGKESAGARFKITDQVSVLADLGLEGDLRARVRYLLRFR